MASSQSAPRPMSILAQAKPAIISPNSNPNQYSTNSSTSDSCAPDQHQQLAGELSEKVSAALRLSHPPHQDQPKQVQQGHQNHLTTNRTSPAQRPSPIPGLSQHQKLRMMHIDDECLIDKQNAVNQMRQAAVMQAIASQQQSANKQRLSATERLAMTAKRPPMPSSQKPSLASNLHLKSQSFCSSALPPPPPLPLHQNQNQNQNQNANQQPARQPVTANPTKPGQVQPPPVVGATNSNLKQSNQMPPPPAPPIAKQTSMPTLETLLAVQRQLQRHTRQNLNSTSNQPQDLVKQVSSGLQDELLRLHHQEHHNHHQPAGGKQDMPSAKQQAESAKPASERVPTEEIKQQYFSKQYPNLSKLPAASREQNNYVTSVHETYDKELPPLPASISPSSYTNTTTSDESQMNSLESQSSPATSLISLPPPPPPISSYLQQYDEVNQQQQQQQQQQHLHGQEQRGGGGGGSLDSNASSPQTTTSCSSSSSSEISSIRHFPTVPIKQQPQQQAGHTQPAQVSSQPQQQARPPAPTLAPRPQHLTAQSRPVHAPQVPAPANPPAPASLPAPVTVPQPAPLPVPLPAPLPVPAPAEPPSGFSNQDSCPRPSQPPPATSSFPPMPPPPVLPVESPSDGGFDEPDHCLAPPVRFPTPPPPDMLLDDEDEDDEDLEMMLMKKRNCQFSASEHGQVANEREEEEDDDDDFQCRIPTPPPGQKSMSFASFQAMGAGSDLCRPQPHQFHSQQQQMNQFLAAHQQNQQHHRALFSSSSFSVPTSLAASRQQVGAVQPPPLFRQDQQQQPVDPARQQPSGQHHQLSRPESAKLAAPQLTVRVNEDAAAQLAANANASGLLSTTAAPVPQLNQSANLHQNQVVASHNQVAHNQVQHHFMMNAMVHRGVPASSSSPSSSSDGDGHSSNSSSSTSGVHSSIDSPSLKSETDFNYAERAPLSMMTKMKTKQQQQQVVGQQQVAAAAAGATTLLRKKQSVVATGAGVPRSSFVACEPGLPAKLNHQPGHLQQQQQQHRPFAVPQAHPQRPQPAANQVQQQQQQIQFAAPQAAGQRRNSSSSVNSTSTIASANGSVTGRQQQTQQQQKLQNKLPRPALKQKKSVSFSDRIELVACAEEQCEDHLPNPLLARVLAATKSQ